MTLDELKTKLASEVPQLHGLAMDALRKIHEGIGQLAKLGHHTHLEMKDISAATVQFPQMLHKAEGKMFVVESSDALEKAKGEGWSETPVPAKNVVVPSADAAKIAPPVVPIVAPMTIDLSKLPSA